jgi:Flp pilus assembly protein TadG
MHLRTTPRRGRARRATTVTELAITLPVVLVLLLGVIDFSLAIYAYGTVSEAARCGARYAIVHGSLASSPVGPTANDSTVQTVVQNNAAGLTGVQVTSSWPNGSNDAPSPVTVTATCSCPLFVGRFIGINSVTVSGTTTMLITH